MANTLPPCLRPLRAGTERPALIISHGIQGDPTFGAFLSKALSPRQPVYTYSAPGLDGREPPVADLEQLAKRYVAEALPIPAPHGVILAGLCLGGHVALKMSILLEQAGVRVRHLFLIDTPHKMPPGALQRLAQEQQEVALRRLQMRPEIARYFAGGPATLQANVEAVQNAAAVRYDGDTTLIASEEWAPLIADETYGWTGWLPAGTPLKIVAKTRAELTTEGIPRIATIIKDVSKACVAQDEAPITFL